MTLLLENVNKHLFTPDREQTTDSMNTAKVKIGDPGVLLGFLTEVEMTLWVTDHET